jgi:biotin operon repressor
MITLFILIVALIAAIFYALHKLYFWQKRLRKETSEVSTNVTKAFRVLRKEVQKQIEKLNKKPGLTKKEKKMRDKLQEALDISEASIEKEIKDIKKELE